jgi:hypothetical protein
MQLASETVPPAALRQESLPLRAASQNEPEEQVSSGLSRPGARVENDGSASAPGLRVDEHIQRAIQEGRELSGLLADCMKQNISADTEESNLRTIMRLADELRSFRSPAELTIGFVGDSGSGK